MISFSIYLNKNAIDRVNKKETNLNYLKLKEKITQVEKIELGTETEDLTVQNPTGSSDIHR